MKNNSTWENMIKPVVVLFAICFVVSGLLAKTNDITAPIIAENALKAEQAALLELLPEATSFTEVENVDMENVNKVYASDNNVGYVVTSAAKGYGGDIEWMTAFDAEGTIVGAKVLSQSETAGLGAKVEESWFQEQFTGKTEELTPENIDMISGATISSKATIKALNAARNAFNKYGLGMEVVVSGPEVTVSGNTYSVTVPGFMDADTVIAATVENGTITSVTVDESANPSVMMTASQVETITSAIVNANSADVDGVAGVTFTSDAIKSGVKAILDAIANGTAVEGEITSSTPVEETDTTDGAPADEGVTVEGNVYTAKAEGFMDSEVVVKVTIENGAITAVEVDESANSNVIMTDAQVNEITSAIINTNSADVDGIAGVTFTSDAIKAAVKACLDAAK